jgi:hypothetical protein
VMWFSISTEFLINDFILALVKLELGIIFHLPLNYTQVYAAPMLR